MEQVVHIQLGRIGDLIMLLPCWKKIFDDTGQKPIVIVNREFSSLFKGTSYVQPDPINGHWYGGVSQAAMMARIKYGNFTVTQCHGGGHTTDKGRYATFGDAMWDKAGFTGQYGTLPTVFDRRNTDREVKLIERFRNQKPMLLYNFMGLSSPLPCYQIIQNRLRHYGRDFNLVNLGSVRAERFYDLLGLYDIAAGLVSIDTATLHLANASPVKLLAYCRGGWSSAIPKRDAVRIWYADAERSLDALDRFVQSIKVPAYA